MSRENQGDLRRHNFFIIDNEILDDYLPVIGPTGYLVYSYLVRKSRDGFCFPKVGTICNATGLGESTVRRDISILSGRPIKGVVALDKAGLPPLIRVIERKRESDKRQTSSRYQILDISKAASTRYIAGHGESDESRLYEITPQEQDYSDKEAEGIEVEQDCSESDSGESSSASAGDSNAEDQEPGKVANEEPGETPFGMASEVYRVAGVDFARLGGSEIGRQCAVAKRMIKDGVSISEAREIALWLLSDNFRAKNGIDMFAVERNRSKWYTATGGVRRDQFEVDWSDDGERHVADATSGDNPWDKMFESMMEDYLG